MFTDHQTSGESIRLTLCFTFSRAFSLLHSLAHFFDYFFEGILRTPQAKEAQEVMATAAFSRAPGKSQKVNKHAPLEGYGELPKRTGVVRLGRLRQQTKTMVRKCRGIGLGNRLIIDTNSPIS